MWSDDSRLHYHQRQWSRRQLTPARSLNRTRRESRVRRWWRSPVFLLALTAGLSAFVIQSGELGTADTTVRLQTATSLWTDEPQVPLDGFPEFVIHGRGGKPYSWYGIGQSLLMLPADIVGTKLEQLPVFAGYDVDPGVRSIVVSYSTNILINVLTALVCFRFLRLLRFSTRQSVAGVMALLFCTTHLHYAQNMMENNYIMLLTLAGLTFQYEWLLTGSGRALLVGSTAFGLNLLTRLTTGLDLLAGGVFLLLVLWLGGVRGRPLWQRFVTYARVAAPVYLFFVADRSLVSVLPVSDRSPAHMFQCSRAKPGRSIRRCQRIILGKRRFMLVFLARCSSRKNPSSFSIRCCC